MILFSKSMRTFLVFMFIMPSMVVFSQNTTSTAVKAKATVVDKSGIELVTIKNMDVDASTAVDGKIYVSAQRDPAAAVMMIKGRANAKFRVTFLPVVEITNTTGDGVLLMHYEVYGYPNDNQSASEPIDAAERTLQISREGKYYFWVGGRIDISNARPGDYDGEFTLQIEYI